jgi:hypothetical protein
MDKKSEAIKLWNRKELSNDLLLESFEADICARLAFKSGKLSGWPREEFDRWLNHVRVQGYSFRSSKDFLSQIWKHYRFYIHTHPARTAQRWRFGDPERRRSTLQRRAYSSLMALERLETLEQADMAAMAESIRGLVPFSSAVFDPGLDLDPPSRHLVAALSNLSESNPEAARFAVLRLFAGQTLDEIASRTGHSLNETYKTWLDIQSQLNRSGVQTEAGIWLPIASDDVLRAISEDPRLLQQVSWREFERIMADLLARLGFQIELQQGTKDGGIDILALRGGPFGDHRYLIQAKRWTNKVGVEPVRQLLFLQGHYRATKGCLATTSTFTRGALELAAEYRWQLDLKDLRGIQAWVAEAIRGTA